MKNSLNYSRRKLINVKTILMGSFVINNGFDNYLFNDLDLSLGGRIIKWHR